MGIKKDKLLRLGQKLLPLKVKELLVKYDVVKGFTDTRRLVCDDFDMMEFYIPDFNYKVLRESLQHIMNIYDLYLKDDPYWHFIFEGDYTLIRCSYKYVSTLEKYFQRHDIKHKEVSFWKEGTYVTTNYQPVYKEIFHWTSILAIQMTKNKDEDFNINTAADRIVHVFMLQAIYLAELNGDLDKYRKSKLNILYWEAEHMSNITKYRTYHIGTIAGHNALRDYWGKIRKEQEESKCLDTNGQ